MKKEADEIQSYTITKNSLNKIKGKGTHLLTGERLFRASIVYWAKQSSRFPLPFWEVSTRMLMAAFTTRLCPV